MTRNARLSWLALATVVSIAAPAGADEYLIYTDGGIPGNGTDVFVWCQIQPCDFAELQECGIPEGVRHYRQQGTVDWQGFGVFHNLVQGLPTPVDLSNFVGGELRFFVKSPFELKVEFQCEVDGTTRSGLANLAQGGWDGTDTWQELVIPLEDFLFVPEVDMAECLGAVLAPYMSTGENLGPGLHTFRVDNVRWRVDNAPAGPPTSVEVSGRELLVNGEPFVVNAIAYSPISIGEDFRGALRDRPDRYLIDFPLIADSGANAVRVYSTFLSTAMLDAAWAEGLFVIPTFQVDAGQLTCPEGREFMKDRFRDAVMQWKDHPALLLWLVGNEVNINLGNADLCADWYPQLDALAEVAHLAEGETFHPVGTATAEMADICQPSCSDDTALPNVDFWGTQLYRGCSFGTAFTEYAGRSDCERPLIVTEFGADAWDSLSGPSGAEDGEMQAECIGGLLNEADQVLAVRGGGGVSAGQVLFEWADEWWKAFPNADGDCSAAVTWSQHDTCKNFDNFSYPDPAINEEWWGITAIDAFDPDARVLREAHVQLGEAWHVGSVCQQDVVAHDGLSGETTVEFEVAAGSTDHTLYYGSLDAVSTFDYSGSVSGLGATGSSTVTLPDGPLFWVIVGRNNGEEGSYGFGSDASERSPSPDAVVPQDPSRTHLCSQP